MSDDEDDGAPPIDERFRVHVNPYLYGPPKPGELKELGIAESKIIKPTVDLTADENDLPNPVEYTHVVIDYTLDSGERNKIIGYPLSIQYRNKQWTVTIAVTIPGGSSEIKFEHVNLSSINSWTHGTEADCV